MLSTLARRLDSRIDGDVAEGPNRDVFARLTADLRRLSGSLDRIAADVAREAEDIEAALTNHESALAVRHATQEAEYSELVAKLHEETGRSSERAQLQQRFAEVVTASKELDLRHRERREKEVQRQQLTARLSTLRDERYAFRKRVTEKLVLRRSSTRLALANSSDSAGAMQAEPTPSSLSAALL